MAGFLLVSAAGSLANANAVRRSVYQIAGNTNVTDGPRNQLNFLLVHSTAGVEDVALTGAWQCPFQLPVIS